MKSRLKSWLLKGWHGDTRFSPNSNNMHCWCIEGNKYRFWTSLLQYMLQQDELEVTEVIQGLIMSINNTTTVHRVKATGLISHGWTTWWATVEKRRQMFSGDHRGQRSSPDWAPCPRSPWHTGKWCGHWRIYQSRLCYWSPSWSTLWGSVDTGHSHIRKQDDFPEQYNIDFVFLFRIFQIIQQMIMTQIKIMWNDWDLSMSCSSCLRFDGCLLQTACYSPVRRCSIGFRSGLRKGHFALSHSGNVHLFVCLDYYPVGGPKTSNWDIVSCHMTYSLEISFCPAHCPTVVTVTSSCYKMFVYKIPSDLLRHLSLLLSLLHVQCGAHRDNSRVTTFLHWNTEWLMTRLRTCDANYRIHWVWNLTLCQLFMIFPQGTNKTVQAILQYLSRITLWGT